MPMVFASRLQQKLVVERQGPWRCLWCFVGFVLGDICAQKIGGAPRSRTHACSRSLRASGQLDAVRRASVLSVQVALAGQLGEL